MAAYCAKADLVERYGIAELAQLTDETAAITPDDAEITKACDEATSLIDAYVSSQYLTPLSPVPTIVRQWACVIARKFLWKDRALADSVVAVNYDEAMKQLRDAAKGVIALPDAAGTEPVGSGGLVSVNSAAQVFTDDVLGMMPG